MRSLMIAWIVARSLSALNSRRVVTISHSTMPSENTSPRRSSALPRACSGDMYEIFPLSVPVRVLTVLVAAFATPKSTSFVAPSYDTSTFDGDTSRWTISSSVPSGLRRSCA